MHYQHRQFPILFALVILILSIFYLAAPAHASAPEDLVGQWQAQTTQGPLVLIIQADNHLIYNGSPAGYTLLPGVIMVMTDAGVITYPYKLTGDVLEIQYPEGFTLQYKRVRKEAPKTHAGKSDRLSQLLVSSAWCSFSFSGGSQYSRTNWSRVQFFPNGTYRYGSRDEGSFSGMDTSSGYNQSDGSVYHSQDDSGASGRWEVRYGRLYMSEGSGPLEEIGLNVTTNSNGYPILQSEGKEYSMCD